MNNFKKYYQKKTDVYGMSGKREEKIIGLLGKNIKGLQILEIGCSDGYFGEKLIKLGGVVTGTDISQKLIVKAKKVLNQAKIVDPSEGKLPFKTATFDVVIASELIEHLFQPQVFLKEINRVTKKKGKLVLTTPNLLYWGNRLKFMKGEFVYQNTGVFDEGHIHFYTHQTLKDDLVNSGFKITQENHVFAGNRSLNLIKSKLPGVFAYQFVVVAEKSN